MENTALGPLVTTLNYLLQQAKWSRGSGGWEILSQCCCAVSRVLHRFENQLEAVLPKALSSFSASGAGG